MAGKGSRPGERGGGRRKGTRNKATVIREQAIAASGELPLDYMLRIMPDPNEDALVRLVAKTPRAHRRAP
jgi:hypothetical protein